MASFDPWSALIGGVLIGAAAAFLMLLTGRVAGSVEFSAAVSDQDRAIGVGASRSSGNHHPRRSAGRIRYAARRRMYLRPWNLRHRKAFSARSLSATVIFMLAALVVVAVTRHVVGL